MIAASALPYFCAATSPCSSCTAPTYRFTARAAPRGRSASRPASSFVAAREVRAGAKRTSGSGEHDGADGVARAQLLHPAVELGPEGGVQRVELLRPVERDHGDASLDLDQDRGLVSHLTSPAAIGRPR